jgi:hypothetical protein
MNRKGFGENIRQRECCRLGGRHYRGAMKMKQLLAVMGILALAVAPGHGRDGRDTRMAAKSRTGLTERGPAARKVRGAELLAATGTVPVPIAIDSETGELYWVKPRSAGRKMQG